VGVLAPFDPLLLDRDDAMRPQELVQFRFCLRQITHRDGNEMEWH
jgi:uncharacterized protein YcaQ